MKKTIIDNIQESIRDIQKDDEPAIIIVNQKTYRKLQEALPSWINSQNLFGLPIIVINMKEECIVLPKKSVEMIKNAYK
jgi:vacuolar-type H+-ATPase subunit F/Vma7